MKYWAYGIIIMLITNNIIVKFIGGMPTNEEENRQLLLKLPLYSAIVMCFLGPLSEEIMFRLNFKKDFNNDIAFAVFSGLLFGFAHVMISTNPLEYLYIIPYGTLGFCFAMAYSKTKNIFTSITLHSFHNILTILLILLSGNLK
jgi:membrane protease YdiL (CAAX protease family)